MVVKTEEASKSSTLSLHDALPILAPTETDATLFRAPTSTAMRTQTRSAEDIALAGTRWSLGKLRLDRKSTRLNSSHSQISYAVFCLKKKTYSRNQRRL